MALTWDLSEVANYEEVCFYEAEYDDPNGGYVKGDKLLHPVTNALIWACMAVDLPGITEENAPEFFARLRFTEELSGAFLIRAEVDGVRPSGKDAFFTPEEVLAHVGLKANVSKMARAAWLKKFGHDLNRFASSFERKRDELRAEKSEAL